MISIGIGIVACRPSSAFKIWSKSLSSFAIKSTRPFSTTSTNEDRYEEAVKELPKARYYVPRAERGENGPRSVFEKEYMINGETRLSRHNRTCPTRELNFGYQQWERHKSPYRKLRHMSNMFLSAPFQRLLFPDLFCLSSVAAGVIFYNEVMVETSQQLAMNPAAFAGATTAIGLLAGFRLNNSYKRYGEGRKFWSDTSTSLRDLSRLSMMYIKPHQNPQLERAQKRLLLLCQAFPVTLMFHLNGKGCHHNMKRKSKLGQQQFQDRVHAEFQAELFDIPANHKPDNSSLALEEDLKRIAKIKYTGGNAPLEVLTCMAEAIDTCSDNGLHPIYIRELDMVVQRLCQALGSSERVLKTPLPAGFTRHSSRLLFIWSNCLPFALYPLLGPIGTLPTTLLTSYAVLGIEDISVQLEEPFDILPLRQYSDAIIEGVQAIEEGYKHKGTK